MPDSGVMNLIALILYFSRARARDVILRSRQAGTDLDSTGDGDAAATGSGLSIAEPVAVPLIST